MRLLIVFCAALVPYLVAPMAKTIGIVIRRFWKR